MIPASQLFQEELYLVPPKTTIILTKSWRDITADERLLLQKILNSIKLSLESVTVLHQAVLDVGALTIRPAKIVYFGNPVPGLQLYELITIDTVSIVLAPSLTDLQNDQPAKQKLWVALKQLFGR